MASFDLSRLDELEQRLSPREILDVDSRLGGSEPESLTAGEAAGIATRSLGSAIAGQLASAYALGEPLNQFLEEVLTRSFDPTAERMPETEFTAQARKFAGIRDRLAEVAEARRGEARTGVQRALGAAAFYGGAAAPTAAELLIGPEVAGTRIVAQSAFNAAMGAASASSVVGVDPETGTFDPARMLVPALAGAAAGGAVPGVGAAVGRIANPVGRLAATAGVGAVLGGGGAALAGERDPASLVGAMVAGSLLAAPLLARAREVPDDVTSELRTRAKQVAPIESAADLAAFERLSPAEQDRVQREQFEQEVLDHEEMEMRRAYDRGEFRDEVAQPIRRAPGDRRAPLRGREREQGRLHLAAALAKMSDDELVGVARSLGVQEMPPSLKALPGGKSAEAMLREETAAAGTPLADQLLGQAAPPRPVRDATRYSEMNVDRLREVLGNIGSTSLYAADTPDLALGQGTNRGVHVEFDSERWDSRYVRRNMDKPGLALSSGREFELMEHPAPALRDSIKSIRIEPEAKGGKTSQVFLKRFLAGWQKSEGPDGAVTYRPPELAQKMLRTETAAAGTPLGEQLKGERGSVGGGEKPPVEPTPQAIDDQAELVRRVSGEIGARVASGESLENSLAGYLNLDKFPSDPAGERRAILQVSAEMNQAEIQAQRRGVVPFAQTRAEAAAMFGGVEGEANVQRWLERTPGMNAKSPAELQAMMQYTSALTDRVFGLQDRIKNGDDSSATQAEFVAAMHRLGEMVSVSSGAQAEAARSLSILRTMREASANARQLAEHMQNVGPEADVRKMLAAVDVAKAARERGDWKTVTAALRTGRRATSLQKAVEILQSLAMATVVSPVQNVLGNSVAAAWAPVPRTAGGAVGALRQGVARVVAGKEGAQRVAQDRIALGEGAELALGGIDAITDFARAVLEMPVGRKVEDVQTEAKVTGEVDPKEFERARIRAAARHPLAGGQQSKFQESPGSRLEGPGRYATQSIFWAYSAPDALFRTIAERGQLFAAARRRAKAEGLPIGMQTERRIHELVDEAITDRAMDRHNPLLDEAKDFGHEQVFTNELPESVKHGMKAVTSVESPIGAAVRSQLLFLKTPGNIMRWAARNTPGLQVVGSAPTIKALAGRSGGRAFDEAAGRVIASTGLAAAIIAAYENGYLTGGFDDQKPGLRAARLTRGEQEYAWKDPRTGEVNSYRPLEPMASVIGTTIDAWTIYKHSQSQEVEDKALDAFSMSVLSLAKQIEDQSFMQNGATIVAAIADPEQYGQRLKDNLVRTVLPTGPARYFTRRMDPYQRQASTTLERLQADLGMAGPVPKDPNGFYQPPYRTAETFGMAHDALPPKQDFHGRPIQVDLPLFSNKQTTTIKDDPVLSEIAELGLDIKDPPKKLEGTDARIPPWDYFNLVARARGQARLDALEEIQSPDWKDTDRLDREQILRQVYSENWNYVFSEWLDDAAEAGKITTRQYEIQKHGRLGGQQRAGDQP